MTADEFFLESMRFPVVELRCGICGARWQTETPMRDEREHVRKHLPAMRAALAQLAKDYKL